MRSNLSLSSGTRVTFLIPGSRARGQPPPPQPQSSTEAGGVELLMCPFRAQGPRVDGKCKVSKISSVSPAQGRSLSLEMEKPEPGSAPLERRGGEGRGAQGGEGHLKEAAWLRQGRPYPELPMPWRRTEPWKGWGGRVTQLEK